MSFPPHPFAEPARLMAKDMAYAEVFASQLKSYGRPADLVTARSF